MEYVTESLNPLDPNYRAFAKIFEAFKVREFLVSLFWSVRLSKFYHILGQPSHCPLQTFIPPPRGILVHLPLVLWKSQNSEMGLNFHVTVPPVCSTLLPTFFNKFWEFSPPFTLPSWGLVHPCDDFYYAPSHMPLSISWLLSQNLWAWFICLPTTLVYIFIYFIHLQPENRYPLWEDPPSIVPIKE